MCEATEHAGRAFRVFARVKGGITVQQAIAQLQPRFRRALETVPPQLRKEISWRVRPVAHGVSREREVAVRVALGASRLRLARQTLTESLILSAISGHSGMRSGLGAMCATLGSGLLFGMAPALRKSPSLIAGGWHSTPRARGRLRSALVTIEIAFSMVLLSGAGLLLDSLWKLESVPLGMQTDHVLLTRFVLGRQNYNGGEQQLTFCNELERRLSAAPGIETAAITDSTPPSGGMRGRPLSAIAIEGRSPRPEGMVGWRYITPSYFAALGIPIVKGRAFTERDRDSAAFSVILSERLARMMFPDEDPTGKHILRGPQGQWTSVVGVVRNVTNLGATRESWPEYYIPRKSAPGFVFANAEPPAGWRGAFVVARTTIDPRPAASSIRTILPSLDPTLPVEIETMDQRLHEIGERPRFYAVLLAAFASMGMLIAAIGLFGLISFLVAQRTREIGIRMALGATPAHIVRLTLHSAARWTAAGVVFGAGASAATALLFRSLLFGIRQADPGVMAAAIALLCAIALMAAAAPARRASSVDPAQTLRSL